MRKSKINYFVSSEISNNQLTQLMNFYGSDKGGKSKIHNFSDYYSSKNTYHSIVSSSNK